MAKLTRDFYLRDDVVQVSRELLGKLLVTKMNGMITSGIITETEAYNGIHDRASHAYNNRRTERTEIMYREGGIAYIYLCYGIHSLFNVVTNKNEIPNAVLIRGIKPVDGIKTMMKRRIKKAVEINFTKGPGSVSQALGIHYSQTGESLLGNKIWIENGISIPHDAQIIVSKRIGVDYAGKDALLPYRFVLKI